MATPPQRSVFWPMLTIKTSILLFGSHHLPGFGHEGPEASKYTGRSKISFLIKIMRLEFTISGLTNNWGFGLASASQLVPLDILKPIAVDRNLVMVNLCIAAARMLRIDESLSLRIGEVFLQLLAVPRWRQRISSCISIENVSTNLQTRVCQNGDLNIRV